MISVGDEFFAVYRPVPAHGCRRCAAAPSAGRSSQPAPHEYVYGRHEQVIRCPWHGWEFDLESGRSLLEPKRVGLRTYRVTVEEGDVVVHG